MKYLIFIVFFPFYLSAKTLIFTTAFNRPDFIELQDKLFKKLLKDDYEFLVFSDANTLNMSRKIVNTCNRLGIKCINVPQSIHDIPYLPRQSNYYMEKTGAGVRHCNVVQWAWDNFIVHHKGPVMLIDSDMFPIRPFSVKQMLEGYNIGGVLWGTDDPKTHKSYGYLWIALMVFDMEHLPDPHTLCFNCGKLPNTDAIVDSGGYSYLYLKKYSDLLKVNCFDYKQSHTFYCPYRYTSKENQPPIVAADVIRNDLSSRGFNDNEIKLVLDRPDTIELLYNNHFLHYRAGSNYDKSGDDKNKVKSKTEILLKFFNLILESN